MTAYSACPNSGSLRRLRAKRRALLASAGFGAALWLAAGAGPAHAQAVNATPSTVPGSGSVTYSRDTIVSPGSETITINTNSAIINWTPKPPLPDPYVFLPTGAVVTFDNGPGISDYAVLNRILTNVPSRFEGTVLSFIADSSGRRPGGTILFSSPGGIIVGGSAVFDVGNLVLTSLNVVDDGAGNFITPSGGFQFSLGAEPTAAVITEAGSQIIASSENSYVALVAPRVIHGGSTRVNGSTAYIAADAVEFSVNQGLFDIVVTSGSDNATPIIHTGSTGGPASTGGPDNHRIYAVAVARNQAITMLLQGAAGYDAATVVGVDNGAIVLSAGHNIVAGNIDPAPVPAPLASIAISDGQFTSTTVGRATANITATATTTDPLSFTNALQLDAAGAVSLVAGPGADITVGDKAGFSGASVDIDSVTAGATIAIDTPGAATVDNAVSGGSISILADGVVTIGSLTAADDILVDPISVTIGSAVAGGDISLDATTFIDVGSADAGDDFVASAGTTFNGGTIIARGTRDSEAGDGPLAGGNIFVDTSGDLRLDNGDAANRIRLSAKTGSIFSDVLLDAGTDLNATADVAIDITRARAGDDFVANAGTTFTGDDVAATGLGADSEAGAGPLAGSNIDVDSTGNLRLDTGSAPSDIQLTSITGSIFSAGTLTANRLLANASLDLLLNDVFVVGALNLTTTNGRIAGHRFESDGNIDLNASGTVTLAEADSGGTIAVVAGGLADLGSFVAVGDIGVTAPSIDFDSATAGRDVALGATANIVLGAAQAGDDVVANAGGTFTGGTVTITGAGADSEAGAGPLAGRNVVVDAVGNLRLDTGTTPGLIDLASSGASVLSSGTLTANRLAATAARDFALNNVSVVAPLALATTNGSISGNSFTSGGDISLDASGTVIVAAASSGRDILLVGGGNIDVGTATAPRNFNVTGGANGEFTNVTAASIAIGLVGTARFDGTVAAPTIGVSSSDIDVAAGSLGNAATQLVALTARPTGRQTVLGGAAQGPGYTLTDAEADRISAATLTIQASPNGTLAARVADVLVRDLSLSGQRVGLLQIATAGILQVEGGLLLSGVRPGGGIDIRATERLQIVNPTGSIRVRDGAGLTDGNLLLVSNNIWSANQALLDQLRADSNFAGRDEALLANNGAVEPRGYIEAGDVVLSARDSLFVQNSGTLAAFAGITVRQTTLRIVPTGAQPLRVFAFGRRINPDGSFVTNNAFFNEVQYQGRGGPVGYTDDAQFNLCFINTGICRLPAPNNPLPGGPDIIEEPVGGSFTLTLPGATDDLVDTSFADEPLIEEPVTSGGDSILWDCDNDDDGDCDEDDYDG